HRRTIGNLLQHHRLRTDAGTVADAEWPQHLRAGADDDVVAERRMPLLAALLAARAGAAERHAGIEGAVVADLAGLADHHAHAVVDEQAPADPRAGMDLDPGHHTPQMRD